MDVCIHNALQRYSCCMGIYAVEKLQNAGLGLTCWQSHSPNLLAASLDLLPDCPPVV